MKNLIKLFKEVWVLSKPNLNNNKGRIIKAFGVLTAVFFSLHVFGQLATYDVTADINAQKDFMKIVKMVQEAKSQTKKQKNMLKKLEENQKFLTKVSGAVMGSEQLQKAIEQQENAYSVAQEIGNTQYDNPRVQVFLLDATNGLLEKLESNINGTSKLVSDKMVMSDAERLDLVNQQEQKAEEVLENLIVSEILAKNYNDALKIYNSKPVY